MQTKSSVVKTGDHSVLFTASSAKLNSCDWYIGSGATVYMTVKYDWMQNWSKLDKTTGIPVASGEKMSCIGNGDVTVDTSRNGAMTVLYFMKNNFIYISLSNFLSPTRQCKMFLLVITF